ncbi:hypothetical protein NC652_004795 [Populus alba x Populus x berolinensis]|nr:hypothetical protein NC652_004795 [Populus alba x Populus x berolinensis]
MNLCDCLWLGMASSRRRRRIPLAGWSGVWTIGLRTHIQASHSVEDGTDYRALPSFCKEGPRSFREIRVGLPVKNLQTFSERFGVVNYLDLSGEAVRRENSFAKCKLCLQRGEEFRAVEESDKNTIRD